MEKILEALYEEAVALEHGGDLDGALARYAKVLEIDPNSGVAHFRRGLIFLERATNEEALLAFDAALSIKPESHGAHYNRGNALLGLQRYDEAIEAYQSALQLNPAWAGAWAALGVAQEGQSGDTAAIESYQKAIHLAPDCIEASLNLAKLYQRLKRTEAGEGVLRGLIAVMPDSDGAQAALAGFLLHYGRHEEALPYLETRHHQNPTSFDSIFAYGEALWHAGRLEAAIKLYETTLEESPQDARLWNNLGGYCNKRMDYERALAAYQRAIEIDPTLAGTFSNRGLILLEMQRFEAAIQDFRQALALDPQHEGAFVNLGAALSAMGEYEVAIDTYRDCLKIFPNATIAWSNLLFGLNFIAPICSQAMLDDAKAYGEVVSRISDPCSSWGVKPLKNKTLRIGWVSADLRGHPVGFFLTGILEAFAQRQTSLEFAAYMADVRRDEWSARIEACCVGWESVTGMSDQALAEKIRNDQIDILIDLSGHTAGNRLPVFAWRPAPVQVTWLGYFATTGVAEIDYLIADPWTLLPSEEPYFTETIWRLTETRLCFTPPVEAVPVSLLPAFSTGIVTFACFNALSKVNDQVVALWSKILQAIPNSRLLFKGKSLVDVTIRTRLIERFAAHGLTQNRLLFEGHDERVDYFRSYHRVDISLDPFPYPGGTTTVESLWMGVPVLTLTGERFLSRQGVGLLMNAGLSEWVAADEAAYLEKAIYFANHLPELALLRSRLREEVLASPIFDAQRFTQHFEGALRQMWARWCDSQETGHLMGDRESERDPSALHRP